MAKSLGIKNWFDTKFIPFAGRIGNQRHLSAIRDAFALFIPILIAGSLAIVLRSAVFAQDGGKGTISGLFVAFDNWHPNGGYKSFLEVMNNMFVFLQWGAISLMSIYFAFGLGYFIAQSRGNDTPVIAGLVTLAAFLAGTDTVLGGIEFLGANGLIGALVAGLLFSELFCALSKWKKLYINMPNGVPPAVSRSFARLFPAIITLGAAALLSTLISMPFFFLDASLQANGTTYSGAWMIAGSGHTITLTSAIFVGIVQPFLELAKMKGAGLGIALAYVLLISVFWFFGLHGTNIINAGFNPIWLLLFNENVNGASHVFVQGTFDAYIFIGGWAATLPLLVATMIFAKKDSPEREISKFALPAGVFQINEPVTFGYPLILNVTLIIPLLLVMPVLTIITWLFIGPIGLVKPVIALIPWTTPVGFGGLIGSADLWGFVLAIFNFFVAAAIWTPFVLLNNRKSHKENAALDTVEGKKFAEKQAKANAQ